MPGDALLTNGQVHSALRDERAALPKPRGVEAKVLVTFLTVVTKHLIDRI